MIHWKTSLCLAMLGWLCADLNRAVAQSPAPPDSADPSGYTLFHPTPKDQMRELSTDRPDQTEAPYTVDAGHFQIEIDLGTVVFEQLSPQRNPESDNGSSSTVEWGFALINAKVGLRSNLDLQMIFDSYVGTHTHEAGKSDEDASGTGDLQTRVKLNLWGNDGGRTAFAVMPFVKWPIASVDLGNDYVETGIILPLAVELSGNCGLGLMTEFDFVRDESDAPITEFVNSATVGYSFTPRLGGYLEFFSSVPSNAASDWQGQADVGFTFATSDHIRFDLGCNFGVTDSAPDFNPFTGLSFRI